MVAEFNNAGIHFKYPENWQLEQEETEDGWSVSVQSPASAFFFLCLREDMPTQEEMLETTLNAMRAEYPDLESEQTMDSVGGQPALGHDIRFFSLDLTNTCWVRSFYAPEGTVLLLCQCNDLEADQNELVLRAICASLEVDED